jgi:hypothetical protein
MQIPPTCVSMTDAVLTAAKPVSALIEPVAIRQ